MDKEREILYSEFDRLGIPVDVLDPLSNSVLRHLLGSIKNAVIEYREDARLTEPDPLASR